MEYLSKLQSLLGLIAFPLIAWTLSEQRKPIDFRPLIIGIVLQLVLATLLLHVEWFQKFLLLLNDTVSTLENATIAGTTLVFGYLGGGELPFVETETANSYILGLRALTLIILISALTSLLSYWRILPWIIGKLSQLLENPLPLKFIQSTTGKLELYDLQEDPNELTDLSEIRVADAERLKGLFSGWLNSTRRISDPQNNGDFNPEVLRRLKALGYIQ